MSGVKMQPLHGSPFSKIASNHWPSHYNLVNFSNFEVSYYGPISELCDSKGRRIWSRHTGTFLYNPSTNGLFENENNEFPFACFTQVKIT